jgi:hypothetical protein
VARLYANENFPLRVVEALRQLGHDVLTVREAGHDNQRTIACSMFTMVTGVIAAEQALGGPQGGTAHPRAHAASA